MRLTVWMIAAALWATGSTAQAAREFAHPDRIRYDGQCLTIDGDDRLIFSAAFNFDEMGEAQWAARFKALKAAGFNTVTTRVPAGGFSAAAAARLRAWLHTAHAEFGFYSIVIPSAENLAAVGAALAPEQLTHRAAGTGGVILCQLPAGSDAATRLMAMLAAGVDVPVFTCDTPACRDSDDPELRQVFDGLATSGTPDQLADNLEALESAQPDAPAFLNLPPAQPVTTAMIVDALRAGATIISCGWSSANFATGEAIGHALARYGNELARAQAVPIQSQAGSSAVAIGMRRTRATVIFLFATNHSASLPQRGRAAIWLNKDGVEMGMDYRLPVLSGKLLRLGVGATELSEAQSLISLPGSQ